MRKKSSAVETRARRDRVVCVGRGLYQWAHRRTWPRAVGAASLAIDDLPSRLGFIRDTTHLASNGTLVGRLALDGEGDTVGGLGLDLKVGLEVY